MTRLLAVLFLALAVAASGCVDGNNGQQPTGEATGVNSDNWCQPGSKWEASNPQTGERSSMNVEGMVTHDGRQTCKAVWDLETAEGVQQMEMYFNQDETYSHMILYNENNQVQYEMKMENNQTTFRAYDENGTLISEGNYSQ